MLDYSDDVKGIIIGADDVWKWQVFYDGRAQMHVRLPADSLHHSNADRPDVDADADADPDADRDANCNTDQHARYKCDRGGATVYADGCGAHH